MTRGKDYPIVYTLMKITDYTDWDVEETVGYVVSKAYLVSENVIYSGDGNIHSKYSVVFPYHSINDIKLNKRHYPEYGIGNHEECYNSSTVDILYSSFEEADLQATILNKELLDNYCRKCSFDAMKEARAEFRNIQQKYKVLEELIQESTTDMCIEPKQVKVKVKS